MNPTKKIILALTALAAAGAILAQQTDTNQTATTDQSAVTTNQTTPPPPAAPSGGLLGKRYVDLNFGVQDIRHVSKDAYTAGLSGNFPVAPGVDLGAGYSHSWLNSTATTPRVDTDVVQGTVTLFPPNNTFSNGAKPFVAGGIGYQWDNATLSGTPHSFSFTSDDDYALWALAAGVEIPFGAFSLTPAISYNDDFRSSRKSVQAYNYGAEANYWVTDEFAVYAGASYQDVRHSSFDSWIYDAGVRLKF